MPYGVSRPQKAMTACVCLFVYIDVCGVEVCVYSTDLHPYSKIVEWLFHNSTHIKDALKFHSLKFLLSMPEKLSGRWPTYQLFHSCVLPWFRKTCVYQEPFYYSDGFLLLKPVHGHTIYFEVTFNWKIEWSFSHFPQLTTDYLIFQWQTFCWAHLSNDMFYPFMYLIC